jgi:NAD-dependent deacetylase
MPTKNISEQIDLLSSLIVKAEKIVALSGAGMSTESGIPDFRSPGTGLWEKVDPSEFASINSYVSTPGKNVKFMLDLGMKIFKAKPHKGHKALTKLQKMGKLEGILTQNIDGLHQRAGCRNVIELHGTASESICLKCDSVFPITKMINQVIKGDYNPSCPKCNGLLKPNAIFFGEPLKSKVLIEADKLIADCDLLLVLGSSLLVYPVAFYPQKVLAMGSKVAIINIQPTNVDNSSEVVIHQKIGNILPRVVEKVEKKIG